MLHSYYYYNYFPLLVLHDFNKNQLIKVVFWGYIQSRHLLYRY